MVLAIVLHAQRCDRCTHELPDTGLTLRILDWRGACGAIASQSLQLSAKLGIEVAARQLKERIGRVLFNERAEDGERLFILLIVTMEIQREIEARDVGCENALCHGVFEQAYSFLL